MSVFQEGVGESYSQGQMVLSISVAYKVDLPGQHNVSATFNVADLSPYEGGSEDEAVDMNEVVAAADEADSRSSLFQEGEYDAVST